MNNIVEVISINKESLLTEMEVSDGITSKEIAIVTFSDSSERTYYVIKNVEIYNALHMKKEIYLKNCYIEEFSLALYRKKFGYSDKARLLFNSIAFNDCLFNGNNKELNMSNIEINGSLLSFINSIFYKVNSKNFSNSKFNQTTLLFNDTKLQNGNISLSFSEFNNVTLNFSKCVITSGNIYFNNLTCKNRCQFIFTKYEHFSGNVEYRESNLENTHIVYKDSLLPNGEISFKGTLHKKGRLYFNNCDLFCETFNMTTYRALVLERVSFNKSRFKSCCDILFELTTFLKTDVDFNETEFANSKITFDRFSIKFGNINFYLAKEIKNILFDRCKLDCEKICFESIIMNEGSIRFEDNDFFDSSLSFNNADLINSKLRISKCTIKNIFDLRMKCCDSLEIRKVTNYSIIDIRPIKKRLRLINLHDIRNEGRIDIDWIYSNLKHVIFNQSDISYSEIASQFLMLKQNYNKLGYYEYEDEAYFMYKKCKRLAEKQSKKRMLDNKKRNISLENKWYKSIGCRISCWLLSIYYGVINFVKLIIFEWNGGYATKPKSIFINMLIAQVTFALLYSVNFFALEYDRMPECKFEFLKYFQANYYFSIITFFTIGYGDIKPKATPAVFLSGIEGFVGVFLMSYFTVAFARKILR
ncbi:potassium channel family protein [Clostridium diolis]|uniref:potassium channel family protein n=1 Tax=Clostridium diolis TaxID=223919 RepID=UPI003AF8C2B6